MFPSNVRALVSAGSGFHCPARLGSLSSARGRSRDGLRAPCGRPSLSYRCVSPAAAAAACCLLLQLATYLISTHVRRHSSRHAGMSGEARGR
ncbi:hypothetical protein OH77DRAFT_93728 [Trametes cingulata]|nr:hypothetical protein OH77DRAFT_93728 [Trametes cingulata]